MGNNGNNGNSENNGNNEPIKSELELSYNGDKITSWQQLAQELHATETKVISIQATAPEYKDVKELKATHNAPSGALEFALPDAILAGQTETITITIHAAKFWNAAKLADLFIDFDYTLVRSF